MPTLDGVTYKEQYRGEGVSPVESYDMDSTRAVRVYDCDWNDRHQFVGSLLGFSGVQGNTLVRKTPHVYDPDQIGVEDVLFATRVTKCVGIAVPRDADGRVTQQTSGDDTTRTVITDDGRPVYKKARLTVEYETVPYYVLEDDDVTVTPANSNYPEFRAEWKRYTEVVFEPGSEFLSTPFGSFKYVLADKPPVPTGVGRVVPFANVTMTWYQVPFIPPAILGYSNTTLGIFETMAGTVNRNALTFKITSTPTQTFTFQPEQLLLLAPQIRYRRQPGGDRSFDICYRFVYRPQGHNYFLKPNVTATPPSFEWTRVSVDGTDSTADGNPVFNVRSFEYLWSNYTPFADGDG